MSLSLESGWDWGMELSDAQAGGGPTLTPIEGGATPGGNLIADQAVVAAVMKSSKAATAPASS